ncbi:IclR family transcriptional regulator [Microbacterium sp. X-17]|uniref:IclR family transcriptional regulator n=1 Tax=Microbacterium sp. X-17 TaxID=3144404 RepID=UPI0031F53E7E
MSTDRSAARPAGTQLVGRVTTLLRLIGAAENGCSTAELALKSGLSRPTAHRILMALERDGFTGRNNVTGSWVLGEEMLVLGSVAASRDDRSDRARGVAARLSSVTGESAFFSVLRGEETACLIREEGSFPLRSFVLFEGVRFPLGVASAGLAILSFCSDGFIHDYLDRTDLEERYGAQHSPERVWERIAATRKVGYAVNPGLLLEGSWGMAAAVFNDRGDPFAAVSLTGVETRFRPERQTELGRLLRDGAFALSSARRRP